MILKKTGSPNGELKRWCLAAKNKVKENIKMNIGENDLIRISGGQIQKLKVKSVRQKLVIVFMLFVRFLNK